MQNNTASRSVTVEEVAAAMGLSKNAVYAAADAGTLPFPAYRVGRRFVIPREPFERVMKGESPHDQAA